MASSACHGHAARLSLFTRYVKTLNDHNHHMTPSIPPDSLIAGLRAERRQRLDDGPLRVPNAGLQHALDELTQEIREGKRDGFRALLEGCLTTDNPRGAAAAFIDRFIPSQETIINEGIERDGEFLGYYRTPPIVTLEVSNALQLTGKDILVDVGGGNGTTSAILALLNPNATIVCLEFQEELARQASTMKDHFQIRNMEVVNDDAFKADLSSATVLYMYYPFSDRLFSRFLDRLNPETIPDFLINGNNPDLLHDKFQGLTKGAVAFANPDLSWWRGNIRA
jgi:Putative methyltransferase